MISLDHRLLYCFHRRLASIYWIKSAARVLLHLQGFYVLTSFHEAFFATQTTNSQSTYQPLFALSAASAKRSLYHCFSFLFFILSPIAAHPIKQSSFHGLRYMGSGACVTWSRTSRPHCSKRFGRELIHLYDIQHVVNVELLTDDKTRGLTLNNRMAGPTCSLRNFDDST